VIGAMEANDSTDLQVSLAAYLSREHTYVVGDSLADLNECTAAILRYMPFLRDNQRSGQHYPF
jgi:hypothetical protein